MLNELFWQGSGGKIYFLESARLVAALYRAKIRLCGRPLQPPAPGFVVSLPEVELEGLRIPAFLASCTSGKQRRAEVGRLSKRVGGEVGYRTDAFGDYDRLSVVAAAGSQYSVVCVPVPWLDGALAAPVDRFASFIGGFREMAHVALTDEEGRVQAVQVRLACALMAYLEAMPSAVVAGLPGGARWRELPGRATLGLAPATVAEPPGMAQDRAGAATHYRSWYFRHYPLRRDGGRRDGMVFVRDALVNAWAASDPGTVLDRAPAENAG